jgi:hypothetical protein
MQKLCKRESISQPNWIYSKEKISSFIIEKLISVFHHINRIKEKIIPLEKIQLAFLKIFLAY